MFKPYDRELTMGLSDEELPTWAKTFFFKLETNRYLGKILGFEKKEEEGGERTNLGELGDEDLEENMQALKRYMAEKGGSNLSNFVKDFNAFNSYSFSIKFKPRAVFGEISSFS